MSHYEQNALPLYGKPRIEDYLPNNGWGMNAAEKWEAGEHYRQALEQWKERTI
jgi:hypothetical protein